MAKASHENILIKQLYLNNEQLFEHYPSDKISHGGYESGSGEAPYAPCSRKIWKDGNQGFSICGRRFRSGIPKCTPMRRSVWLEMILPNCFSERRNTLRLHNLHLAHRDTKHRTSSRVVCSSGTLWAQHLQAETTIVQWSCWYKRTPTHQIEAHYMDCWCFYASLLQSIWPLWHHFCSQCFSKYFESSGASRRRRVGKDFSDFFLLQQKGPAGEVRPIDSVLVRWADSAWSPCLHAWF